MEGAERSSHVAGLELVGLVNNFSLHCFLLCWPCQMKACILMYINCSSGVKKWRQSSLATSEGRGPQGLLDWTSNSRPFLEPQRQVPVLWTGAPVEALVPCLLTRMSQHGLCVQVEMKLKWKCKWLLLDHVGSAQKSSYPG